MFRILISVQMHNICCVMVYPFEESLIKTGTEFSSNQTMAQFTSSSLSIASTSRLATPPPPPTDSVMMKEIVAPYNFMSVSKRMREKENDTLEIMTDWVGGIP